MKNGLKRVIPLLILVAIIGGSIYYLNTLSENDDGPMKASGTVEAVQIKIAPELSGRVDTVQVKEGEHVTAQQVLVELDTSLLEAQLHQAESALAIAQANYNLIAAGSTPEQKEAAIAAAEFELAAAQQALDTLYKNAEINAAQANQRVATYEKNIEDAQQHLDNLNAFSDEADIDAAFASMILARDQLEKAQEDFEPWENKPEENVIRATFQSKLAQAQQIYDAAVRRYNNLRGIADEIDLTVAEANLTLLEAQLEKAKKDHEILQGGPDPDDIELAEGRLANAKAQLTLAQTENPTVEQLAVAQAQVDSALTQLEAIQVQIEKMTITAPTEGVVLSRLVEPGETTLPNSPLLTIAQLNDLTITVFVPEDRYGEITLGQSTQVMVDSFPNQTFPAKVIHIADQAEFTPRNVQTAESRQTTVFAIKLSVNDTSGKLKPGMPADVVFTTE